MVRFVRSAARSGTSHYSEGKRIQGVSVEPNHLLRGAREARPSLSAPGEQLSRAELAEAVNDHLWWTTGKRHALDVHAIARYERGKVRWPNAAYRAGLKAILRVASDADLGFSPVRRGGGSVSVGDRVQSWEGEHDAAREHNNSERRAQSVKHGEFCGVIDSQTPGAMAALIDSEGMAAAFTRPLPSAPLSGPRAFCVPRLAIAVRAAKSGYQSCSYRDVAQKLPWLISELEHSSACAQDEDLTTVHILRAKAYQVAASLLLKAKEQSLAGIAADRSMRAAESSGNPETRGTSARIVAHALMDSGHHRSAIELAVDTAAQVDREISEPNAGSLSVYGALLLRGSVAAARCENRGEAMALLDEAQDAAVRLGADRNCEWTAFGPTNVLLHRVSVAIALGDAGSAVDYARQVQLDNIDVVERKATLFIDVARAYSQWGKLDRAYEALVRAEHCARQELRRPATQTLINEIGTRASGHLRANMSALATKTG